MHKTRTNYCSSYFIKFLSKYIISDFLTVQKNTLHPLSRIETISIFFIFNFSLFNCDFSLKLILFIIFSANLWSILATQHAGNTESFLRSFWQPCYWSRRQPLCKFGGKSHLCVPWQCCHLWQHGDGQFLQQRCKFDDFY